MPCLVRGVWVGRPLQAKPSLLCPQTQHRCKDPLTRELMVGKGIGCERLDGLERVQPQGWEEGEVPTAMAGSPECPMPLCHGSGRWQVC